jgi:hypothetical protein
MCGALAGCSQGWKENRINPSNWFSANDRPESLVPIEEDLVIDNRPLVPQVTALSLDETPSGVIVRATGVTPTAGYWQGGLVLEQRDGKPDNGQLSFVFRAAPPLQPTEVSNQRAREITAARFISNQQLQGVETIRIVGERNSLSSRL